MKPSGPTFKRFIFLALVGLLKKPTRQRVNAAWLSLGFSEQDMAIRRNIQYLYDQYDVVVALDKALNQEEGGTYVVKNWAFIHSETFLWKFRSLLLNAGFEPTELRTSNTYTEPVPNLS